MLEVGTGFHGELTGRENVYMNGAILGMSKKEVDAKMEDIIEFSECRPFIDTPVKRYSSGMYVKLAFAVAANLDSEILVMDEVLAVGDMKFQEKCLGKMGDVAQNEGRTVLYVSHNMATIRKLCTRCVVLNKGKLIYDGDVETAIEYYLGAVKEELPAYHDFRQVKRAGIEKGNKIFLNSMEMTGRERAVFTTEEIMEFTVEWEARENIENGRLRFVIVRADGNTVGMTCSEPVLHGKKGQVHRTRFSFDCRNLVEGVYSFHMMAFETNEYGGVRDLDKPEKRMYFEIVRGEKFLVEWSQKWWGSVRLNPFVLLGEE
jgi:lipopolysaccharide transport system ATP-binding protein